jgi:hypothetical protein
MAKTFKLFNSSFLLLFISVGYRLIAQPGTATDIRTLLDEYCMNFPWEEIYIHSDRNMYIAGEELWFSGYVVDKHSGQLSSRSKIAYVELLNPDNVPVIQKRLLINEGICPGNAHLPDTLTSGTYTLRIYTNRMKNFLPENALMKDITIINLFRNKGFRGKIIYGKHLPAGLNIEFHPEGGILLNDVQCKIAVRICDEYQKGISYEGVVLNSSGDSVASFRTDKYGLASFEMTPLPGNSYYVLHNGTFTYLPQALDEGCTLKADYLGKKQVTITIFRKGTSYSSDNQEYSLLIHSNGNIGYSESFRITGNSKAIIISKQGLPRGVNQITLFSHDLKPLCERMIYIGTTDASDDLEIKVSDRYRRRDKVTIDIDHPKNCNASILKSGLSISVIPVSYQISSREFKDYLDFGTQYGYLPWRETANQNGKADEKDYDNFLIGAKSQWIQWIEVFTENEASLSFNMEEDLHFLSGIVKQNGTILSGTENSLTLTIPGKIASYYHARINNEGYFSFPLPVDQILKNLVIQPGSRQENFSLEIQSSFSRNLPLSSSFKDSVPMVLSGIFSDIGARYQVNKIFEASVKKDAEPGQTISVPAKRFYGKPEIELIMDDYIKLPVMQEVFFELIPGVRLRERRSGYEMKILNPLTENYYNEPATVMIDGVIINDLTTLVTLDPDLVEKIDVITTPYLTGDFIHNGIVHVITRSGKFNNLSLPDDAVNLPYRVTEPVPFFSSPDYSNPVTKQSRVPDFRNTLYWNPSVKPDKDGKISVAFWTSDLQGDYVIDIHGITSEGKPVSIKKVITVY